MFPLAARTIKPHCYHRPVFFFCCLCCRPFEVQNSAEEWALFFIYLFIFLYQIQHGAGCALSFINLFTDLFFFPPAARADESNQNAALKPFDFATKVDGLPACKLPIR